MVDAGQLRPFRAWLSDRGRVDMRYNRLGFIQQLGTRISPDKLIAMLIRPEFAQAPLNLEFLQRCFRFVSEEWPHAVRVKVPDEGFEQRFRESCDIHLRGWLIAPNREMWLGAGLETLSGTLHEVDIVARTNGTTAAAELKNLGGRPGKNDIIVFFAKILDYVLANPQLMLQDVCLAFLSRTSFDDRGLAACLGLGIHPVASDIRPLPVLINNARAMQAELDRGLAVSPETQNDFETLCVQLNRLGLALGETWFNSRFRYNSSESIVAWVVEPIQVDELAQDLRQANSDFIAIYDRFRRAKGAGDA